jgi:prevent-host-death family protein
MTIVNMHKAKTHLSRLIGEVEAGHEVVIARGGQPAARLLPIETAKPPRKPGYLKGRLRIAADFDAALPERTLKDFEGR